jgi:hypothetical protein
MIRARLRHPRSIDAFYAANTNCRTVYAIENRYKIQPPSRLVSARSMIKARGVLPDSAAFGQRFKPFGQTFRPNLSG